MPEKDADGTLTGASPWLEQEAGPFDDPLPPAGELDVLVVGAGVTGLTTALLLARAGRRVAVVDAGRVGGLTTGNSTGKISLLQGTLLSSSMKRRTLEDKRAYVRANEEAQAWVLAHCDASGVAYQRRRAVTYAETPEQVHRVHAEHDAARAVGLGVELLDHLDAPFPHHAAVALEGQAQLDPGAMARSLAVQLRAAGGTIHEGRRVRRVALTGTPSVRLDDDTDLGAAHLVLATGSVIADRGLHFARVEPQRSYALAFALSSSPHHVELQDMYLSAGAPSHSVRDAPAVIAEGRPQPLLVVGGEGNVTGRTRSVSAHFDRLRDWANQWFGEVRETHAWAAQDYRSWSGLPTVGPLPGTDGKIWAATGFNKWGLTTGVAAAQTIADHLTDGASSDGDRGPSRRPGLLATMGRAPALARINAAVSAHMAGGHVASTLRAPVDDRGHLLVCTHLGGPLRWNDAEGTWDCTLHGSRFDTDGEVVEGPATRPLCPAPDRVCGALGGRGTRSR